MSFSRSAFVACLLGPALLLGACAGDMGAESAPPGSTALPIAPSPAEAPGDAALASAQPVLPAAPAQPSSSTAVGQKVGQIRGEVERLRQTVSDQAARLQDLRATSTGQSQSYFGVVAAINARLQVGTTPGNPILVAQWREAQQTLEELSTLVGQFNTLGADAAATSTVAAYLLDNIRATFALSGAVEEDHRQLRLLEDEVNRTTVAIGRQLNELTEESTRQSAYVATERSNLQALSLAIANGELYGTSLANRAFAANVDATRTASAPPPANAADRRPLVIIRFDRDDVKYEQQLYQAVGAALERRPNAVFDLVAVTPTGGSPAQAAIASTNAKRHAEGVLRSLLQLGLPSNRLNLSANSSGGAQSPEVHLFVR
ncbi:MAG TPA: hypothetical protein VEH84_17855 [Alphaproteobacteria bacterium]|nr:hypothetical protein [Alphaproteobacteria bacterium]